MCQEGKDTGELSKVRLEIKEGDIHPEIPEPGGTVLVLQVNARDNRDHSSPDFGALMPDAAAQTVVQAKDFFESVFEGLSPEGRANVAVIILASDAPLNMPGGVKSEHRRAFETAERVIEGARLAMASHEVDENQLLNNTPARRGEPVPIPGLVDLKMWQYPGIVRRLQELWGSRFWSEYERRGSRQRVEREAGVVIPAEVESQIQIMTRVRDALTDLTVGFAGEYHRERPNSRLIIWCVGMYDNLAPFAKAYVLGKNPGDAFVPMEKGAGFTVKISPGRETATATIGGQEYPVPALLRPSSRVRRHAEARPKYS